MLHETCVFRDSSKIVFVEHFMKKMQMNFEFRFNDSFKPLKIKN